MTEPSTVTATERETLATLFDLGRQVASVLDLEELLPQIPQLISRLIEYKAFAVYLLDEKRGQLGVAYSVGYDAEKAASIRLRLGEGLVGAAVLEGRPLLVNDVRADTRYIETVPGILSELVVPLRRKSKEIGALNVLSDKLNQFSETDVDILRQFGAHVAVAIENARLFESERRHAETLGTLAGIGREVTAILAVDELLTRIAQLTKRVVDYRTFGILLIDEATDELELKVALHFGEKVAMPRVKVGSGLVGYAALHKEPVLVSDVGKDPRYIKVVEDVRSELVIPILFKDRCLSVFDLESPELDAFTKDHVEIMTLLASQAAVALENARLYGEIRANEVRLENELRFAQRVQAALLPISLPKRLKQVDVAARFAPARELGGDLYDFLCVEPNTLGVAVGDVSGKGVPAALYSAFAGELIRSRAFRRRFTPAGLLASVNTILHERQLEEYYCTLCYANFDFKRRCVVLANSGLPFPIRCAGDSCAQIELPGVPMGSFAGSVYEEVTFEFKPGDLYVFCTDGVFEAMDVEGREFAAPRLVQVVAGARNLPAKGVVDAVFEAVKEFRGEAPPNDDMTAVAIRIEG